MTQGNIKQENAIDFILGGNALFTFKSSKTGTRFTYKVLRDTKREDLYRVSWMNGSDNTKDYRMIGNLILSEFGLQPMSIHTKEIPAFIAFDYIYQNLSVKMPMPSLEIWHEGRCCKCGRTLTVPESIERGMGPECYSQIAVV